MAASVAGLDNVEIWAAEDAITLATWKNTVIFMAHGRVEKRHMDIERDMLKHLLQTYPQGVGIIGVVDPRTPLSDAETRRAASALFEELGPNLSAFAFVLDGQGVWASALRATLTGILMVVRSRFPVGVFHDVASAADWYAKHAERGRSEAFADSLKIEIAKLAQRSRVHSSAASLPSR